MKDVLDEKLQDFIKNILPAPDDLLAEMTAYAEANHISIVEPEVWQSAESPGAYAKT